ncbi:MAG TPA: ATP-binding protein, partial [Gammaproteobacteria bacterium]
RAVNPVAEPVFGGIPGSVIGRDFDEVIHNLWGKRYADEVVKIFRHTLETGEPYVTHERAEFRIDLNVTEYYEWHLNRITLPDGHYGVVCYFRDVSQQVEARKEIERSRDALREIDRRKDEFLAILAHELRNPLAPIRNSAQILRLPEANAEERRTASETLDRQIDHMVRLVDDLLDVSRITRGKIGLRKRPIELSTVINQAVEAVRPLWENRHQELKIALPAEPVHVNADPSRLAQVVGNLLHNAYKFSRDGGEIQLSLQRENAQAVIRVRDNGIGIAEDQLSHIFDMFTQVDTSLERPQSGLGIGLTLVKNLVEMHQGTVEATSPGIGKGTEFAVRLPLLKESYTPLPQAPPAKPKTAAVPRRILIVDDNPDQTNSMLILLKIAGHEVHVAVDGLEAVNAAAELQPDIILLDIGLPKLNGYEAARRIREQQKDKHIVLVAVTGWGQEEDRRRSREAGFDTHMVKPLDFDRLKRLLAELKTA